MAEVLLVSQPVEGGVAACVLQLVAGARDAGHHVTVVSPARPDEAFYRSVVQHGARHVRMFDHKRRPGPGDVKNVWRLRNLMRASDVTHLHSSKAGAVGRLAAISLGRSRPRIVFTPHAWSWFVGGRCGSVYALVERGLAGVSDVIVAVSEAEAVEGRSVLGRSARKLLVIANGVDRRRFSPDGPVAPRDETTPLIVCVGRLAHQKGQDVAIRSVAAMRENGTRLRLVGDGPEEDRLKSLARQLGMDDRIEWMGAVDDVAPHLRAADIVVAPSRWEGLSLVLLEAMACGCALVVTDVAGSEVVGDGGEIVDVDDAEALTATMDALMQNSDRRCEMGKRGRDHSRDFDFRMTIEQNLQIWES